MKKRWIILIIVVLLIGVGWYNFFVPHGSARKRLAEYKKELIAKGERLDLMSFELAVPKGISNGAAAFLAVITNWTQPKDFTSRKRVVAPAAVQVNYTNLSVGDMAAYETNKAVAKELRAILNASELYFDLGWSNAPNAKFFHIMYVKSAAMLFYYTAIQAMYTNDVEEAVSDVAAGAKLARLYCHEPTEISALVRNACAGVTFNSGWELLQSDGFTDAQLAGLQTEWERFDLFSYMEMVFAGERAFDIAGMAHARKATNAMQLNPFAGIGGAPASGPSLREWFGDLFDDPKAALKDLYERYPKFWMWKSVWSFEEELCGLQNISAALETSRKINTLGYCAPALVEFSTQSSNIFKLYPKAESHFLESIFDEPYPRVLTKAAQAETSRRLLITAIALKRFQMRNGHLPERLDELVPDFLQKVPLDFMDGKPLRYKPVDARRYLLYSVGEDGKDDGGDGSRADASLTPWFLQGRDIVWPQPATEEQIKDYLAGEAKRTNAPPAK